MNNSDRDPDAIDRIREDKLTEQKWKWPVAPDGMSATVNARLQEQAARIAELESELKTMTSAAVEAGAGVIEAQRDELQRALKAKTDWVEKVGERAAKLASRIASNDYEVQAMESLANELAAATERERRINQRAEILFDGIQGAHDMVTRWLANPSAPATEKLIELAGMLETRMDMTEQPGAAALAASEKGRE